MIDTKIHKQILPLKVSNVIKIPKNSRILKFDYQRGEICVWYEFDLYLEVSSADTYEIIIVGTGNVFPKDSNMVHANSLVSEDGLYVWHIYTRRC